ncbi:hypothetical protein F8G81_01035 [Arthrobacter sp. CDRTa11]|uniref:hypothetical protein n=1 Tax=Arthrobacter sp. CDRTa11 TaxID=2651199 RepID=UPI002265B751|nr:hypothetical protein [Arthrobacter sp. CDRTa11]UZX01358.1 hypothetical protein F8G81_01035 [Arthrobacter sp. CDRTa11]
MSEPTTEIPVEPADDREVWAVPVPPGGWGTPWRQCVELARELPSTQWTLVGGLMVQLHAATAGLAVSRPTADVDIVLHIETGATTSSVAGVLNRLGYTLQKSIDKDAPAHRFVRDKQQIDVLVADHLPPAKLPTLGGRKPFKVAGGTQALQRTVNCRLNVDGELSNPGHRSWRLLESADRTPAMDALRILATNHNLPPVNRLKPR